MPLIFSSKRKASTSDSLPCLLSENTNHYDDKPWMNLPKTPTRMPPLPPLPPVPETPNQRVSRDRWRKSTTATEIVALYRDHHQTPRGSHEIQATARPQDTTPGCHAIDGVSQYFSSEYEDDEAPTPPASYGTGVGVFTDSSMTSRPKPLPSVTGADALRRGMSRHHRRIIDQRRPDARSDVFAGQGPLSSRCGTMLVQTSDDPVIDSVTKTRIHVDEAWNCRVQQCFWLHHQTMRVHAGDLITREKLLKKAKKEQKESNKRNLFSITWSPKS